MSKNTIVTVLAIIGAIVVAGWVLKLTFKVIGALIVVALGYGVYRVISHDKRIGGPRP